MYIYIHIHIVHISDIHLQSSSTNRGFQPQTSRWFHRPRPWGTDALEVLEAALGSGPVWLEVFGLRIWWFGRGDSMGVSKNRGISPQIIHFNKVFRFKPSILGENPIFGNIQMKTTFLQIESEGIPRNFDLTNDGWNLRFSSVGVIFLNVMPGRSQIAGDIRKWPNLGSNFCDFVRQFAPKKALDGFFADGVWSNFWNPPPESCFRDCWFSWGENWSMDLLGGRFFVCLGEIDVGILEVKLAPFLGQVF